MVGKRGPALIPGTQRLVVTEADWQRTVIDAAKMFGWRYAHFRPARTSHGWVTAMEGHKGFPDLVLVRPPRLIIAELKPRGDKKGEPSPDQLEWLTQLQKVPTVEVYLWIPVDLPQVILTLAYNPADAPQLETR